MPRNTRGQSLLSGNVFCGHCGGRLTLTTNGTTRINAAGEKVGRKRIRYVCYNKTRKRSNCDGQTGYTMHILDKMVTDILYQVFDRMRSVEENEIISRTHRSAMVSLKKRLADAKAESAKAAKEYESLKLEIIKAVQGDSLLDTTFVSASFPHCSQYFLIDATSYTLSKIIFMKPKTFNDIFTIHLGVG